MQTIGVALAVPEPWGSRLQDYRASLGDPLAESIPTHVTLIPPTQVAPQDLPAIQEHLAEVASEHRPFPVRLRGTGTFRPVSPVVFAVVESGATECTELARSVRQGPLTMDLAFPFHPHVTLAHDLPEDLLDRAAKEMESLEVSFRVVDFHLYRHHGEDGWVPTRTFPLGPR